MLFQSARGKYQKTWMYFTNFVHKKDGLNLLQPGTGERATSVTLVEEKFSL